MITHSTIMDFCKKQDELIKDCLGRLSELEREMIRQVQSLYKEMGETTAEKEKQRLLTKSINLKEAEIQKKLTEAERKLEQADSKLKQSEDALRTNTEILKATETTAKAVESQMHNIEASKKELRKRALILEMDERDIRAKRIEIDKIIRDKQLKEMLGEIRDN